VNDLLEERACVDIFHQSPMYPRGDTRVILMDALFIGFLLCLFSQTWAMPMVSKHDITIDSEDRTLYQTNLLARSALELTLDGLENRPLNHDRGRCTLETLRVRRDWRALTERERRAYISSILCLQRLPPQTPAALAAGAKTRYDDFLATHINQTWHIHRTVCLVHSGSLKEISHIDQS
jgi:tyrosinase